MRLAGFRVRAERHFARDADPDAAGPRRDDPDDHAIASWRRARTASKFSTGPTAISAMSTALASRMRARPRSRLRRQDADPSRPDRGLQRDLHAARRGSRAKRARSSRRSSGRKTPRAARSSSTAAWWSGCTPRWRGARSRSRTRSRRWGIDCSRGSPALLATCEEQGRGQDQHLRCASESLSAAHAYRLPGIGLLAAAAFRRNMKPDDLGIIDQRRKIRRLEKQFRLGMHRVERFLRQRVMQFVGSARERGQRRGTVDRDADVGEAVRSAAQLPQHEGQPMAQRQPVRRQLVLLHQIFERRTIGSSGGRYSTELPSWRGRSQAK